MTKPGKSTRSNRSSTSTKTKTRAVVLVSDTHCGGDVSLLAPGIPIGKGNIVTFGDNYHQEWLWEQWCLKWDEVYAYLGNIPFTLIMNGDATEGIHHHSAEVVAAAIESHVRIAQGCLEPHVKKAEKTFIVRGTECHTQEMEDVLAQRLGAVGSKAFDQLRLRINGTLIDAQHHMPVTGRSYLEAGAMSIVMGNARLNCIRADQEIPQVFLRGHRHCGGFYQDGNGCFAVAGAWQFLTRHGHKVVGDSVPRPSIVVLLFQGEGLPILKEFVACPPPPDTYVVL